MKKCWLCEVERETLQMVEGKECCEVCAPARRKTKGVTVDLLESYRQAWSMLGVVQKNQLKRAMDSAGYSEQIAAISADCPSRFTLGGIAN